MRHFNLANTHVIQSRLYCLRPEANDAIDPLAQWPSSIAPLLSQRNQPINLQS